MFWKNDPVALYRKGKALVVACILSVLIGVACVILSVRGSFEATIAAMLAVAAAAATGNGAHWAFKDAKKLAREIATRSMHAKTETARDGERRSARLPEVRVLPQNRRIVAFSDHSSARARRRTGSVGKRS